MTGKEAEQFCSDITASSIKDVALTRMPNIIVTAYMAVTEPYLDSPRTTTPLPPIKITAPWTTLKIRQQDIDNLEKLIKDLMLYLSGIEPLPEYIKEITEDTEILRKFLRILLALD